HGIVDNEEGHGVDASVKRCRRERRQITKREDEAWERQRQHGQRIEHIPPGQSLARQKVGDGDAENDIDERAQTAQRQAVSYAGKGKVVTEYFAIKPEGEFGRQDGQKPAVGYPS